MPFIPTQLPRLAISMVLAAAAAPAPGAPAPRAPAPAAPDAAAPAPAEEGLQSSRIIQYAPPIAGFRLLDTCHISADGRRLLLTADNPRKGTEAVRVYDLATGEQRFPADSAPPVASLEGHAISADGSRILVSEQDANLVRHVRVVEVDTGRTLWSSQRSVAGDVNFLDDGNIVLSSEVLPSLARRLSAVDVKAAAPLWQVDLERGVSPFASPVSPDGQFLIAVRDVRGPNPSPLATFSLKTRKLAAPREGSARLQMPRFQMVAGRAEVIGLMDGTIGRWDAESGKPLRRSPPIKGLDPWDQTVFSPDGAYLYHRDGNALKVLDTADAAPVRTVQFALTPDLTAVGPDGLAVLRAFPGNIRVVKVDLRPATRP